MSLDLGSGIGYTAEVSAQGIPSVWVISLKTNQIFDLGMPGSAIWLEAVKAETPDEVVDRLCEQYGWDADVIGMDVADFLSSLVAQGLLKEMVTP